MTIIAAVNVGEITDALVAWLKSWPALVDMAATIDDSEPVNDQPDRCPWVGVYRSRMDLPSRTLGLGAGYRMQRVSMALALTASSVDSGKDCKDRLEALVNAAVSALCSNESISGTVQTLDDLSVVYSNYAVHGASYFQEAVVNVTAVVPVNAS